MVSVFGRRRARKRFCTRLYCLGAGRSLYGFLMASVTAFKRSAGNYALSTGRKRMRFHRVKPGACPPPGEGLTPGRRTWRGYASNPALARRSGDVVLPAGWAVVARDTIRWSRDAAMLRHRVKHWRGDVETPRQNQHRRELETNRCRNLSSRCLRGLSHRDDTQHAGPLKRPSEHVKTVSVCVARL